MVKNYIKKWRRKKNFSCFGWGFTDCSVLGRLLAWQWRVRDRCDVMNIMSVCNIKLKWNRRVTEKAEEMVGGGGGVEGKRESTLNFGIWIHEKKRKKRKNLFWIQPWKRKKVSNSKHPQGWMPEWENQSTQGVKILVRCSANPMILLLMRVSLPSKLRRIKKKEKKETHTYTLTQSYMCIYVLMQYGLVVLLNVLGCWLTYLGQAEAWFNIALHPRKPEGSKGRTAQDGHLDPHTAPELWLTQYYDKLQ